MDDLGMREKYCHSQGATLYDEGRYDEAIEFFEKAIALKDEPYTRYHCALAWSEKGDCDRALAHLSKAIELNPSVAKYYYRRSTLRRLKGEEGMAGRDYKKALRLDPDYGRIEEIRSGYQAMERDFLQYEMIARCNEARPNNRDLAELVREEEKGLRKMCDAMEGASCLLPCPAYCCHFSGELVRHGVYIGAWKLLAVRRFLGEKGLAEGEFLGRMPMGKERYLRRLIPPNVVVRERGEESVYFPRRRKVCLSKAVLKDRPKGRDYQELLWINEDSRACSFLQHKGCMIHDVGDDPGLGACKEFLCLTGAVFVALNHHGLIDESRIGALPMKRLNKIAVESLLLLSSTLYGDETLRLLFTAMQEALTKAIEADTAGDTESISGSLGEYRRLKRKYEALRKGRIEELRRKVESLFKAL